MTALPCAPRVDLRRTGMILLYRPSRMKFPGNLRLGRLPSLPKLVKLKFFHQAAVLARTRRVRFGGYSSAQFLEILSHVQDLSFSIVRRLAASCESVQRASF